MRNVSISYFRLFRRLVGRCVCVRVYQAVHVFSKYFVSKRHILNAFVAIMHDDDYKSIRRAHILSLSIRWRCTIFSVHVIQHLLFSSFVFQLQYSIHLLPTSSSTLTHHIRFTFVCHTSVTCHLFRFNIYERLP